MRKGRAGSSWIPRSSSAASCPPEIGTRCAATAAPTGVEEQIPGSPVNGNNDETNRRRRRRRRRTPTKPHHPSVSDPGLKLKSNPTTLELGCCYHPNENASTRYRVLPLLLLESHKHAFPYACLLPDLRYHIHAIPTPDKTTGTEPWRRGDVDTHNVMGRNRCWSHSSLRRVGACEIRIRYHSHD